MLSKASHVLQDEPRRLVINLNAPDIFVHLAIRGCCKSSMGIRCIKTQAWTSKQTTLSQMQFDQHYITLPLFLLSNLRILKTRDTRVVINASVNLNY